MVLVYCYAQIPCTEFHPNQTINVGSMDINSFMPLRENSYVKLLIKIPTFEMSELGKHFSSLGRSAFGPTRDLPVAVFPTLGPAALTQSATSGQGKVRSFSAVLRFRREYLNSKRFNLYFCKNIIICQRK